MGLETATYISQLVDTNPVHTDGLNQTDAHLKLIKATLLDTFPNFTAAALNSTQAQIDSAVGLVTGSGGAAAFPAGTVGAPSIAFNGDPDSGFYLPAEDQIALSLNGTQELLVTTAGVTCGNFTAAGNATVATLTSTGTISGPGAAMPGAVWIWLTDTAPTGWAFCNGSTVSAASNPGLAALFGSSGGNVTLPDMREVVPVGKGTMGGSVDPGLITLSGVNTMRSTIGSATHTLSTSECPTGLVTLNFNDPGHAHSQDGATVLGRSGINTIFPGGAGTSSFGGTTAGATTGISCFLTDHGGNGSHNIVQPSYVCGFIIKLG